MHILFLVTVDPKCMTVTLGKVRSHFSRGLLGNAVKIFVNGVTVRREKCVIESIVYSCFILSVLVVFVKTGTRQFEIPVMTSNPKPSLYLEGRKNDNLLRPRHQTWTSKLLVWFPSGWFVLRIEWKTQNGSLCYSASDRRDTTDPFFTEQYLCFFCQWPKLFHSRTHIIYFPWL